MIEATRIFPDPVPRVRVLALVLPLEQFAFHLDMCALGERLRELRKLSEDHATVPFGVRDALVVLLVGGLGCQRECREAAIAAGANFRVAAEEDDNGRALLLSTAPFSLRIGHLMPLFTLTIGIRQSGVALEVAS